MGKLEVSLFQEKRKDISIHIDARITEKNELRIEGVDAGPLVEKLKGDWDYEYYLTLSEPNKAKLTKRLNESNNDINNDVELLDWIKMNYSGSKAFSDFKSFLDAEGMTYKTFFYA